MPFSQALQSAPVGAEKNLYPMLLVAPFLDWSVLGSTPPLRFQVDRREGFRSARSSVHSLRSVLQHFYRLEDTSDREGSQVFAKHKPWSMYNNVVRNAKTTMLTLLLFASGTDRELDLRVRQWYGHYPTALSVDEIVSKTIGRTVGFELERHTWYAWPLFQTYTDLRTQHF